MLSALAPLVAIDAVAVDTETTGLDPATARIVQIAGIRILKGRVGGESFATLIDPGVPIPARATAIHGIDAARLAGAPAFAGAWADFGAFAGDAILVGHHIGFDLAVIGRECRDALLAFTPPRALDTALLAAVVQPGLPGTSIEALAAWLGVDVVGRHSAEGDALTAARIFVALVPHLRKRGIRTLGEAEAACRSVAAAMAAAGHASPDLPSAAAFPAPLARVDAFAFSHRCRDLMSAPPRTIAGERPLSEAVDAMAKGRISSLFVVAAEGQPPHGIVTERDVMRALAAGGGAALGRPVATVASSPLVTVFADDFVFRAIGRMTRRNIRHLAVVDDGGSVVGALSARDLMRLRSSGALTLGDEVASAVDAAALAAAFARLPVVASGLLDEGVTAIDVAAVISDEIGAMTARAGELAEAQLGEAGLGAPPAAYAIAVLGSAGRGESLLAADQDNAIIHADTDAPEAEPWFDELGRRIADILDEAGIPYCRGGVMASNAAWRGSVSDWERRVANWIGRSSARDLLNVDIFFDLRPVAGAAQLAEGVWRSAYATAEGQVAFLKLLAESLAGFNPPLTLFGRLRTEGGRVDLKAGGLFPIVSGARLLSLRYGVLERETPARLIGVRALDAGADADIERLIGIDRLLVDLILRQQIEDLAAGVPPSARIAPGRLSASLHSELKEALAHLRHLDMTVRDLLFEG